MAGRQGARFGRAEQASTAIGLVLAAILGTGPAQGATGTAQDAAGTDSQPLPAPGAITTLAPVRVHGQTGAQSPVGPGVGYVATRSDAGTKTPTKLVETPESITVITRQQMVDQDVQNVAQALRYTAGVTPEVRGSWTRYDQFTSRGFELDSNEFLDGLRILTGYQATPQVDPYFLDRIEVVKGPSSVLYGSMLPGGMLNMVSKRPTASSFNEIGLQTGSYGDAEATLDSTGAANASGSVLYRITALARDAGSQVDHERNQRFAVAPAVTWLPDDKTTLTFLANYQLDPKGGFYDFLPYDGSVAAASNGQKIPTSFFTGDEGDQTFRRTQASIGYQFERRLNDIFTLRQNLRYQHVDVVDHLVQGEGWDEEGVSLARYAWNNRENVNTLAMDTQAQADIHTGPVKHTVLLGVDFQNNDANEKYGTGTAPDLLLDAPDYHQAIDPVAYQLSFEQLQTQTGIYAQDQMQWGRWHLSGGVRHDWSDSDTYSKIDDADTDIKSHRTTGRVGLLYLFDSGVAPYFSYSTSFYPVAGTTYSGTPFKPTTGEQYEVGVKYQIPRHNILLTASAFQVTEQNVPTQDPDASHGPYAQVQTGEIRSRGVELEAHADITRELQLIAAYTYLYPEVTKDTTYQGEQPVQDPRNAASLWAQYDLKHSRLAGLGFGGGVRYIGSTFADQANTLRVPDFTVFDAAIHYDLGHALPRMKGAVLSVNISNLFDRTYVSSCDSSSTCYYGLRRTVLANLRYRF